MQKGIRRLGAGMLAVALMLSMGAGALAAKKTPRELWKEYRENKQGSQSAEVPDITIASENMEKKGLRVRKGQAVEVTVSCSEGVKSFEVIGPQGETIPVEELKEEAAADGSSKVYSVELGNLNRCSIVMIAEGKTGGERMVHLNVFGSR